MARLVLVVATSLALGCSLWDPRAETGTGRAVPGSSCPLVVEIDNLGTDPLIVSWVEVETKMSFRIGEAGLGKSVLPVPEYVRARMPKYRGNWHVQSFSAGSTNRQRPNYRLDSRCADPYAVFQVSAARRGFATTATTAAIDAATEAAMRP